MDLTDMGSVAWIAGTLVALVTVLFILWVAFRVANDQDIV
jgi:type IV secretory pathway TrbL component